MALTPLEWFTNKQVDKLIKYQKKIDESLLSSFGWEEFRIDLDMTTWKWSSELPKKAGVYALFNEIERSFLYVGQAKNLHKRVCNPSHHKLEWIINRYEEYPFYYGDRSNPINDIIIYCKEVNENKFNTSLGRSLIWCESITIGVLRPAFQNKTSDIYNIIEGTGDLRIDDEYLEDEEDFEQ